MIKYALVCEQRHEFESWFANSAAYDKQAKRGLVTLPACGSTKVEKAIMAPRLSGTRKGRQRAAGARRPPTPVAMLSPQEQELRAKLKELREHITKNADYVGQKFPEEARKMHYGETEHRSIYGEASLETAKEMRDEGIELHPLAGAAGRAATDKLAATRPINAPTSKATPITISTMPSASRGVVRLPEAEDRNRLREQHLDQRQRAHARGGGERESQKPEQRGESAEKSREQRRPPCAHDRAQHAGDRAAKDRRQQNRLQRQPHHQR